MASSSLQPRLHQQAPCSRHKQPIHLSRRLCRSIAKAATKAQPHSSTRVAPNHPPARAAALSPAPATEQAGPSNRPSSSNSNSSSSSRWVLPSSLGGLNEQVLLGVAAAAGLGVFGSGFELSGPGAVLEALAVLASIIAVHEWGHFTAARLQGIHVTQFAIGFGPPLISFKRGDVEYSLRAIPLGGYVAFPDDDPKHSPFKPDDPDLLQNRSIPERGLVISAGVIANVIFALAVLFAQVNLVGKAQTSYLPGVLVPEVNAGGAAEQAGFKAGDIILRVGQFEVAATNKQVPDLVSTIKAHPNEQLMFTLQRGEEVLTLPATPSAGRDGKGAIGVSLLSHTFIKHTKPANLADAFAMTGAEFNRLGSTVLNGLKQIVTNFGSMSGQLSGPVAIVAAGSEIARTDVAGLFQFCAIVNINLAIVNMLPLPALDGGYLMLLLLEAARGKKLPDGIEQGVMASGLLLMMMLGVGLTIRDTLNLL